jgi:hypothetical protein
MAISPSGIVNWDVPPDQSRALLDVADVARDAVGRKWGQAFSINVGK